MDIHQEERNELAEDEEKLQLALQAVSNENEEWYDYDDVDDEEDEDELLIDLEAPSSTTGQSSSGYVESGSHGHFMTIDDDSQEGRRIPINVPSQVKSDSVDAEKTLALNQALQEILETRIESIQAALEINKEKQLRLNEGAWADIDSKKPGKGRTWGPFRAPFFKSNAADSYPRDNEDTIMKRNSNELNYDSMKDHMHYNRTSKSNLTCALVEDTREMLMKPVMSRLEIEIKKAMELNNSTDEKEDDIKNLKHKLRTLKKEQFDLLELKKKVDEEELEENNEDIEATKREIAVEEREFKRRRKLKDEQNAKVAETEEILKLIKDQTDKQILCQVESEKVDWMKVSKLWFKEHTSWIDCQKAWDFMVNPKINLKPWKKEEETRLLELVELHGAREWDAVAQELGTCRTPFHCFYHYQNRFNPEFKSRPWKKEEDAKLIEAVTHVREMSHLFTWGKVSALVNSRSLRECMQRYSRLGHDRNFGRWSALEDANLIMAVETLGENWRKVSKFVGSRTKMQCKQRFERSLNPELNFLHFSYEDDQKLLQLYKKFGKQWKKIAGHFKGRTDSMMKSRYRTLQKWKQESDWWDTLDDYHKNLLLGKNLTVQERKQFEGQWSKFFSMKFGLADRDYKRQQRDKNAKIDPDLIPARPPIHLKYSKFQNISKHTKKNNMWSQRLDQYNTLLETLKKRIEEENIEKKSGTEKAQGERDVSVIKEVLKNNELRDDQLTHEEQNLKKVMDVTLEDMKAQGIGGKKKIPEERMKQMLSALNLHFLGDSNIFVRDILKSTEADSERLKKLKAIAHHRKRVNLRVRKILSKNKWVYAKSSKIGRHRYMLAIPWRNTQSKEVEKDNQYWDDSTPSMLMKRLGGDSMTLMKSIKERVQRVQKQKEALLDYQQDPEYKIHMALQEKRLKEMKALWYLNKEEKEKLEGKVERKMKAVRKEFFKRQALKQEVLQGFIETGQQDASYIDDAEKNNPDTQEEGAFQRACEPTPSRIRLTANNMLGDMKEIQAGNNEGDVTYSTLDFLPPNLATLSGLRALLLHREKLVKTAGKLYNPEHYKRKRKRQLHIILDCEDNEADQEKDCSNEIENGGFGVLATERKAERPHNIQAIEVVEGEMLDADATDSWFKSDGESAIVDEFSHVDRDLEKKGDLSSTSFAPYGLKPRRWKNTPDSKALMKDMLNLTVDELGNEKDDVVEEVEKPDWLSKVRLEREANSGYEIVFGPTASNIKMMLEKNPNMLQHALPVYAEKEEEGTGNSGDGLSSSAEGCSSSTEKQKGADDIVASEKQNVNIDKGHQSKEMVRRETSLEVSKKSSKNKDCSLSDVVVVVGNENGDGGVAVVGNENGDGGVTVVGNENGDGGVTVVGNENGDGGVTVVDNENGDGGVTVVGNENGDGGVTVVGNENGDGGVMDISTQGSSELDEESGSSKHFGGYSRKNDCYDSSKKKMKEKEYDENIIVVYPPTSTRLKQETAATSRLRQDTGPGTSASNLRFPHRTYIDKTTGVDKGGKTVDKWTRQRIVADMPNLVNRMIDKTSRCDEAEKMVVVGLDPKSGRVTHYNRDKKAQVPPDPVNLADHQRWPVTLETMTGSDVKACMEKVRQTEEYQKLLARFRALFMWPVLMSTTRPRTEVDLNKVGNKTDPVTKAAPPLPPEPQDPPIKRRRRGRPPKKRRPDQEDCEPEPVKKVRTEENNKEHKLMTKPRIDYSKTLPRKEKPQREIKRPDYHPYLKDLYKPKEKTHGPTLKRSTILPDWWKDAIAESIKKKRDIEDGKEANVEVEISGDEDFMDQGEYSDDEWLAELKEEEKRKEEEERKRMELEAAGGKKRGRKKMTEGEKEEKRKQIDDEGRGGDEFEMAEDDDGGGVVEFDGGGEGEGDDDEEEDGGTGNVGGCEGVEMRNAGMDGVKDVVGDGGAYTFLLTGDDGQMEEVALEVTD